MNSLLFFILVCGALAPAAFAKVESGKQSARPTATTSEKKIQWTEPEVPQYPPLAKQAEVEGVVEIRLHFKGCTVDPQSIQVVGGHLDPDSIRRVGERTGLGLLRWGALENAKRSTIECGDFPDSDATLTYDFQMAPKCSDVKVDVKIDGNRATILVCGSRSQVDF